MILSNIGIQRALDEKDLIITPEPAPGRPTESQGSCPYDTCSVNLQLGEEITIHSNPSEFQNQSTPTGR